MLPISTANSTLRVVGSQNEYYGQSVERVTMPSTDVWNLMRLYARRGIAEWRSTRDVNGVRRRVQECLGMAIAERDDDLWTISADYNEANVNRMMFIPMPKPGKGIERCFFLPIRTAGQETVAFELFLLVKETKCLAFRFEPAHHPPTRHGYGHVQMSRKMLRRTIEVQGIPEWLPDSYPAFPISTSNPLEMFLAMATAVHGYADGGLEDLLADIFQKEGRAVWIPVYHKELKEMLIRSLS